MQLKDKFGSTYDPVTMKVYGLSKEAEEFAKDVNIEPRFLGLRFWLIFKWANFIGIPVVNAHNNIYKRNIKGKYYDRKNWKLYTKAI
jgi:hypothetical protein